MRVFLLLLLSTLAGVAAPPNIVLILADDLGRGDVGCFGATKIRTPHIDRLAREGMKFTDFAVAQAVCSASRAALLTGCYANRVGMQGALNHTSPLGIHADELLLPELLQERGYATAIFGKWHLGLPPFFSPLKHGFDEWFGIPYSNDNSKYHPVLAAEMPPLPLYDGERVVETDPDQAQFTRRLTERAVGFIERNKEHPFFLYVPHVMPHVPVFASEKFRGKSASGIYGDCVEELDWSVGEILAALARHGLDEKTLVIFSSDNGPFLSYGAHAGSAGPLREGKLTAYEGGVRVPTIMRWPGTIPAARECREPAMMIDLLPTIAALLGAKLPEHKIDGRDIGALLRGEAGAKSPHEALFIYSGEELHAVRSGEWKLHLPHPYLTVMAEPGRDGKPSGWGKLKPQSIEQSGVSGIASRHGYRVEQQALALYNLRDDVGEQRDVSAQHPEVVARLTALAEQARADLGDGLTKRMGAGVREAGRRP
jgi:arylsulfatase